MTARTSRTRGKTNTGPHKTLRKHLLADLARRPGQPCPRCGLPMFVTQLLDLDHTDDRTGYLGLSHRACNRRDGQRKTTAILKARGWTPSPRQARAIAWKQRQPQVVRPQVVRPQVQPWEVPGLPLRSSRRW